MNSASGIFDGFREFVHRYFLGLLVAAYLLAAAWPGPGLAVRQAAVAVLPGGAAVSLPMVLLALLLFNAGLGADAADLAGVIRGPRAVLAGVAANVLVPVGFLVLLAQALHLWPDPDEAQALIVGLAIVSAMPVAGSSTAWSQNAGGSPALSLGLVVLSTVLSPVTTPLTLAAVGPLATGEFAGALGDLGGRGTGAFLLACVVVPSVAGMAFRRVIGGDWAGRLKPAVKLTNAAVLLVLCYANASAALPAVAAAPDWDFLALVVVAVVALCGTAFAAGWGVARVIGAGRPQERSLVFGLGMSNNGTGVVLACSALAGLPAAVLPVLAYNLVQHLVAGGVRGWMGENG